MICNSCALSRSALRKAQSEIQESKQELGVMYLSDNQDVTAGLKQELESSRLEIKKLTQALEDSNARFGKLSNDDEGLSLEFADLQSRFRAQAEVLREKDLMYHAFEDRVQGYQQVMLDAQMEADITAGEFQRQLNDLVSPQN